MEDNGKHLPVMTDNLIITSLCDAAIVVLADIKRVVRGTVPLTTLAIFF